MSRFEPHGQFRGEVRGRVFCLEIRGAWNMEGLEIYLKTFRQQVAGLVDGQPWASIVDVSGAQMGTADTVGRFNDEAQEVTLQGRTHLAVVGARSEHARWHLEQLFRGSGVVISWFDTFGEGWAWLEELGFCSASDRSEPRV